MLSSEIKKYQDSCQLNDKMISMQLGNDNAIKLGSQD